MFLKQFTEKDLIDFGNQLLSPKRRESYTENSANVEERLSVVNHADLENFKEEKSKKNQPLTFGQKAVGLRFNPSGNDLVTNIKQSFADIIDEMNDVRTNKDNYLVTGDKARHASVAITDAETAQMRAVKAITWED